MWGGKNKIGCRIGKCFLMWGGKNTGWMVAIVFRVGHLKFRGDTSFLGCVRNFFDGRTANKLLGCSGKIFSEGRVEKKRWHIFWDNVAK